MPALIVTVPGMLIWHVPNPDIPCPTSSDAPPTRVMAACCPDCLDTQGLTFEVVPNPHLLDRPAVPCTITCPAGHSWLDWIPVEVATIALPDILTGRLNDVLTTFDAPDADGAAEGGGR